MPKNFSAEIAISTAKARKDIADLKTVVGSLDQGLQTLNKTLKDSQGNLDAAAQSITTIVRASRDATAAAKETAQAKIAESRANAQLAREANQAAIGAENLAAAQTRTRTAAVANENAQLRLAQAQDRAAISARNHAASTDALGNSLSNTRYLLYDVGDTYRTLALGLMAIPTATSAVAASYEKDFAQVIRTSGETSVSSEELRRSLKDLATQIPLTFGELSEIAMIGGQMNIAQEELAAFTETVAKFQATADGVTIDSATTAFGRLQNLFNTDQWGNTIDPEFFRRIGSAISFTADNSVTSEKAILSMMNKMAAVGRQAGLSATEVTALASALTSVGIAPELGRSAVQRIFGNFSLAAAKGGPAMAQYAKAVGLTSDEFKNLIDNDPNQVLNNLLENMQGMSASQSRSFLDTLGIKGVRDQAVITALATQLHVLKQAQEDVADAYSSGAYLDAASAGIFNTMVANLQKMTNAFTNLGDSLGRHALPLLNNIVSAITPFVEGISDLVEQSPGLRNVIATLVGLGGLVGVFLAIKSAQAFVTAGLVSFQHVAQQGTLGALSFRGQLTEMAKTLLAVKGASAQASQAVLGGATGMKALSIAARQTSQAMREKTAAMAADTAMTKSNTTANAQNAVAQAGQAAAINATSTAAVGARTRVMGALGGIRTAASGLFGLLGGLPGLAIAALGFVTMEVINMEMQAKASAEEVARVFEGEAAQGVKVLGKVFSTETVKLLDSGTLITTHLGVIGKSYAEIADIAGVSMGDIAKAVQGGKDAVAELRAELDSRREGLSPFSQEENALDALSEKLKTYEDSLGQSNDVAAVTKRMSGELGLQMSETGEGFETASNSVDDWAGSLNDAVEAAFAMMDAEGALQSAMEDLGAGLRESMNFDANSEGGRDNVENLKATLAAQALLMNQHIAAGELTAEQAAVQYAQFVDGLMAELAASGANTDQIAATVADAVSRVNMELEGMSSLDIPIGVDASQAVGMTSETLDYLAGYLAEHTLSADMELSGADAAAQEAYALVTYISQATGVPFEAVVTAFTDPANTDTQNTAAYIASLMGLKYEATVNADTSPALTNIQNMASFAAQVISNISGAIANVATTVANVTRLIPGMGASNPFRNIAAVANQVKNISGGIAKAVAPQQFTGGGGYIPKIPAAPAKSATAPVSPATLASYDGLKNGLDGVKRGYDDAGKSAKKAGGAGKKAGKDMGKGAKQGAKDVKDAAKELDDYANRLSDAFQAIYTQTYGVEEATDAYYSKLNDITKRRREELQTVKELRESIRSLTAERAGELIEAQKFERMSALAGKHGNTERAADYKNEAEQLRASAAEKATKIATDKAEADTIMKGRDQLHGYSEAAIRNREEIRALEKATLGIIDAHARNGASTSQLNTLTRQLTERFRSHVSQLSTTHASYNNVRNAVDRYKGVVNSVPRTVSTTATFNNKASGGIAGLKNSIGSIPKSVNVGYNPSIGSSSSARTKQALDNLAKTRTVKFEIDYVNSKGAVLTSDGRGRQTAYAQGGQVKGYASGGMIPGTPPTDPSVDNLFASVDGKGMIKVRSGEYIQSEPAVKYYGQDFMDKLNKMQLPRYYMGGSVGRSSNNSGTTGLVDLSAQTIQNIARAVATMPIELWADSERLASVVNTGREIIAQKGGINV